MSDRITENGYWQEIREIVDGIVDEIRTENAGCSVDILRDAAYERLWETLDGHQWVIYTHYNYQVLSISPNDGYAISEWGSEGIVTDGVLATDRMAFGAMFADCMERLGDADWEETETDAA